MAPLGYAQPAPEQEVATLKQLTSSGPAASSERCHCCTRTPQYDTMTAPRACAHQVHMHVVLS